MSDYKKISNHYKKCLQEHGDGHLGHDWPNRQDLLKRYNTMAEIFQDKSDVSILDLGCGTGMFLDFLKNSGLIEKNLITYEGADISQDHIDIASSKFKENKFYKSRCCLLPHLRGVINYDVLSTDTRRRL